MAVIKRIFLLCTLLAELVFSPLTLAELLPEESVQLLHHGYDGGGVKIDGPAILVRKNFNDNISIHGQHYVDSISGASVDVEVGASPYSEERTQHDIGITYQHDNAQTSFSISNSQENDYDSSSAHLSVSQSFFGNLTNVSLGFSRISNVISETGNATFEADSDQRQFRLGLTQILTKRWLVGMNIDTITDSGFLNNPYRQVRYIDLNSSLGAQSFENELYPETRTSTAFGIHSQYHLPYRAALLFNYRFYSDSWEISAHTADIGYRHPFRDRWIFTTRLRFYSQTSAEFYSDLFPFSESQNFRARDKELSEFDSTTIGFGATYTLPDLDLLFFKKGEINLIYDRLNIDYQNFRDARLSTCEGCTLNAGEEPFYELSAGILRLLFSFYY